MSLHRYTTSKVQAHTHNTNVFPHFEQGHLCWHCRTSCIFPGVQEEPFSKYNTDLLSVSVTSITMVGTDMSSWITLRGMQGRKSYTAGVICYTDQHCLFHQSLLCQHFSWTRNRSDILFQTEGDIMGNWNSQHVRMQRNWVTENCQLCYWKTLIIVTQ